MSNELYNGQGMKLLTSVDNFTRESLAIEVDERLGGQRVVEVLMRVAGERWKFGDCIIMESGPMELWVT